MQVTTGGLWLASWSCSIGADRSPSSTQPSEQNRIRLAVMPCGGLGRDHLFRTHPQSPLPAGDPLRRTGLPYWPYDPALRFELELRPAPEAGRRLAVPGSDEDSTDMVLIGCVELPPPVDAVVDVWWLEQYAGGIFLPLRDGSAGTESYGGGRYALDTSKGADLGGGLDAPRRRSELPLSPLVPVRQSLVVSLGTARQHHQRRCHRW